MKSTGLLVLARAMGALLVLGLLLAGVPWALTTFVGWPLPSAMPTLTGIREGLTGATITDSTIIKALALVCWLAWLQIVASTIAEILAWGRGQVAVRLPGAIVQPMVRQLVVTGLLLFGTLRSSPTPALMSAHIAPVATSHEPTAPAAEGDVRPGASAEDLISPTCTVRPRDSLWRLAERHLGDGMRWRELYELNRGVTQLDGRVLSDPDLIRPGWTLVLPPDAVDFDPPMAPPLGQPEIASSPTEPTVPAPASQPQAQALSAASAPVGAGPTLPAGDPSVAHESAEGDDVPEESGVPVHPAVGGLLAAGVVGTLTKLRRVQQRRRQPGHSVRTPDGATAAAERSLRRSAETSSAGRLDMALRALATLARDVPDVPGVEAVSVARDGIEVLFVEEFRSDKCGPFSVAAAGRAWTLSTDVPDLDVESLATGSASPLPALCPVGGVDDREILLDLETPAATAIRGEGPAAAELLWTIGAGLATSEWADDLRIIALGDIPNGLLLLDRVEVADSLASILGELEAAGSALVRELQEAGHSSTMAARAHGDTWTPTIVLLGSLDPDAERLVEIATGSSGIAVLALNPVVGGFGRELLVDDRRLRVIPPGLDLLPVTDQLPETKLIGELIQTAAVDEAGPLLDESNAADAEVEGDSSINLVQVRGRRVAQPEVVVRVIGSVEIIGSETPFSRRRAEEVVVYLALHPAGVDEGRLRTALWPDELPQPGTFNQAVSRARSSLGRGNSGELHLPHLASGGLYRVSSTVSTDVDMLKSSLAIARVERTEESVWDVAETLESVRGLPFEGSRGYEWAHVEGIVTHIEATVSEAAHFVAEWAIGNDQVKVALDAVARGLLASPGDEVLYRDRMLAHDLAGNPAGVEATMAELCRFADDLEPYDSVHPATLELYQRLTRRNRRGVAGPVVRQRSHS